MLQAAKADLMLTAKDLSHIRTLISEEACGNVSFEQLSKAQSSSLAKVDTFRLGSVYSLLLEHSDLINRQGQKVAAVFLLWDLYKEDSAWKNPFANLFIRLVQRSASPNSAHKLLPSEEKFRELTDVFDQMQCGVAKLNDAEIYFLKLLMLGNTTREMWSKKPLEISGMDVSGLPPLDLRSFFEGYQREQSFNTQLQHCSVPAILDDRDESIVSHRSERAPPSSFAAQQQQQMGSSMPMSPNVPAVGAGGGGGNMYPTRDSIQDVLEALLTGAKPYSDLYLRPEMIIPVPDFEPLEPHEFAFLEPLDLHNYLQFEWDDNMCVSMNSMATSAGGGGLSSPFISDASNIGNVNRQSQLTGDDLAFRGFGYPSSSSSSAPSVASGLHAVYGGTATSSTAALLTPEQAVQLLQRGGERPLNVEERQQLVTALHRNPMLAFAVSSIFTPPTLPKYIDNNPTVAAEMLRIYFLVPPSSPSSSSTAAAASGSPHEDSALSASVQQQQSHGGISVAQQHQFMEQLLKLDVTLQYMEAITQLLTLGAMPVQLLKAIIAHCIQTCHAMDNSSGDHHFDQQQHSGGGDKQQNHAQNRLVRLVCVFLMSALQARPLDFDIESNSLMRDTIYEVHAFCVEFSRVKEASQLFRMLKANYELSSSTSTSASSAAVGTGASGGVNAGTRQESAEGQAVGKSEQP